MRRFSGSLATSADPWFTASYTAEKVKALLRVTSMPDLNAWAEAIQLGSEDAVPAVGQVLVEDADTCFVNEADPWGEPWPALKPATVRERARLGKTGKILVRDGVLRGSIAATPTTRTAGVTMAEVFAGGPAAAYAAHQQFGDEHMAGRAYFPIRRSAGDDSRRHRRARRGCDAARHRRRGVTQCPQRRQRRPRGSRCTTR